MVRASNPFVGDKELLGPSYLAAIEQACGLMLPADYDYKLHGLQYNSSWLERHTFKLMRTGET
jgi:hypothetical protein